MRKTKPHQNGVYSVNYGSIQDQNGFLINNPAVLINREFGILIGAGDYESIRAQFNEYSEIYKKVHEKDGNTPDYSESLVLIKLAAKWEIPGIEDHSGAEFSKDEICTLMNYLMNSPGKEKIEELFTMPGNELHKRLLELYEIGY